MLSDITCLSISERIQLVEDIWDSIAADSGALLLTQDQRDELDRRLQAYHDRPEDGSTWEQVKAKMTIPAKR